MSFGASPSDIIIVVTFCKTLYRKCRTAGGEYNEISCEVRDLHTVLRHLKYEVEAPESPLNRDTSIWGRQLAPIIGDSEFTMRQLDGMLTKYGRLASNNPDGNSPTSPRVLWERVRFGSNEMDQLGGIRVKLISHKTSLTLFLDTIQLHQSGKMAETLNTHGGQLDIILDKVDKIATKMQSSGGSIMTNYDDDDKEVWKQFRRELVAEGFSSDVLQQHKDVLRAYIREIDQQGLLEPVPTDQVLPPPPVGVMTQQWLQKIPLPPLQTGPPNAMAPEGHQSSFDSLDTPTSNSTVKEMVVREDNMKFPPSMKLQRPKPETREEGSQRQLDIPRNIQRSTSPIPVLIEPDEKDSFYLNTDGSSESDSETDDSSRRSISPSYGQIITTKNLISMSQALAVRSQSPSSFRSQSSFVDAGVPRSMASRQRQQLEFGTSPLQSGAISIPIPTTEVPSSPQRITSLPFPSTLAPDSHGKPIPSDAKWTKISRRLVSPEVLAQDGQRYEARPEFVAILGILSRAQIQDLTERSHILREARKRKHFPPQDPPPKPPRPTTIPIPVQYPRGQVSRDTPSDDETDSCDSELQARRSQPHIRSKSARKHDSSYTHHQPVYGSMYNAPPSPVWSPSSAERHSSWIEQHQRHRGSYSSRDHERESKRKHISPSKHRERTRDKERPKERPKEKPKSRWKEQLTAAGMGGAAVSLFNVLSEAAEGI